MGYEKHGELYIHRSKLWRNGLSGKVTRGETSKLSSCSPERRVQGKESGKASIRPDCVVYGGQGRVAGQGCWGKAVAQCKRSPYQGAACGPCQSEHRVGTGAKSQLSSQYFKKQVEVNEGLPWFIQIPALLSMSGVGLLENCQFNNSP